jgi:tetratricopeptide (TPR) repeat protein
MRRAFPAVALLVAAVLPPSAAAQSAQEQLQYGIEAYGNLELGAAVAFIRRALAASPEEGLSEAERATALGYLGAAEHYRGRSDSAIAAFRQMVLLNPRYRPDPLVFPPPVVRVYDGVRRSLKVIGTAAPPDTTIRLHEEETFAVQLYASSYHSISSLIAREDGTMLRRLYGGDIGDSLSLRWDGFDTEGNPAPSGLYYLSVSSLAPDGVVLRTLQLPLDVELARQDSLTYPPPPADSLLLPERRSAGPGLKSLGLGLALGALAAGLPQLVGGSEEASNSRYAVGGAIAIGGIIGLVMRPPGAALPDNIAANEVLMYEWQARRDSVFAENVQRLRDVRLHIRTGAPLRIEHEGS